MSCFPFENLNGVLKSYVHGSRYAELQIYSSVSMYLSLSYLKYLFLQPGSKSYEFCRRMKSSGTHRYKTKLLGQNIFALGTFKTLKEPPEFVLDALIIDPFLNQSNYHNFERLFKNKMYFEIESYAI